ncbi:MAG: Hsp20/alpha crystallin family protein [Candidatus Moranbacteria bacterium]|nr:Hsp20/alpha crystallin family protein [Candidatus Moranbacteria bacterium]
MTREIIPWGAARDIDAFLGDFGLGHFGGRFVPSMDVYQDKDQVVVDVSIAGVDPEKVDITIEGDVLTVSGHTEERKEIKHEDYYRKEVRSGSFTRSVILPMRVKGDLAEAQYSKGILRITMPKAEEEKSKKIAVKVK